MSFFCNFIEFGLYVFLEIAYKDSLQQYLTSSDGKTHNKKFGGGQVWAKRAKIGLKIRFFTISQVWFNSFPVNCRR